MIAALGAPVALGIGVFSPSQWALSLVWGITLIVLFLIDAALSTPPARMAVEVKPPAGLSPGGGAGSIHVRLNVEGGEAPRQVEMALEADARLNLTTPVASAAIENATAELEFMATAVRRGLAPLLSLTARWRGPLGLVYRSRRWEAVGEIAVTPDIASAPKEALKLFSRDARLGLKLDLDPGQGSEFHALQDYRPGMEPRAIDWKQSARRVALVAREFDVERNHPILLAVDCGRLMCEPVDGAPRIDHAINAALLLAYVALKIGDRVGVYGFDSRPRHFAAPRGGLSALAGVQAMAARFDYSAEETNFAFGLFSLASRLDRRALVVLFTDFADATSAEMMFGGISELVKRHRVVFVVAHDVALETRAGAEPRTPADVTRAVIADALLQDRLVVLQRLRRMGVEIIQAPAGKLAADTVTRYLSLKRRERL